MDPILDPIDEALARKGLSDAAASRLAVGHPSLLKNLRMPRQGEKRYNLPALQKLAEVLDLEFYFGPRREAGPVQVTDETGEFAKIALYDAALSAGNGLTNSSENIIDHVAFRRDWLSTIGVDASNAALARASGDSMEPCIADGDVVMIDLVRNVPPTFAKKRLPNEKFPIFALLDNGEAKVKRLMLIDDETAMLLSDNQAYAPSLAKLVDLHIIGKVVWWGHINKEV